VATDQKEQMMCSDILLVEDNPDDVVLTQRAFRKANIANEIHVVTDGAAALDYLLGDTRGVDDLPCLVLLDLKLPKVGGLDVLDKIRADERTRCIPVVILTSSKQDEDLIAGYTKGANSYIRKPIEFEKFVEVVGQLGMYWLVLNEPPPRNT
jgi:two-component system response regulator